MIRLTEQIDAQSKELDLKKKLLDSKNIVIQEYEGPPVAPPRKKNTLKKNGGINNPNRPVAPDRPKHRAQEFTRKEPEGLKAQNQGQVPDGFGNNLENNLENNVAPTFAPSPPPVQAAGRRTKKRRRRNNKTKLVRRPQNRTSRKKTSRKRNKN